MHVRLACCPQCVYPVAGEVENSTGEDKGDTPSRPRKETSNQPAKPVAWGAPFLSSNENGAADRPFVSSKVHVCKSSSAGVEEGEDAGHEGLVERNTKRIGGGGVYSFVGVSVCIGGRGVVPPITD